MAHFLKDVAREGLNAAVCVVGRVLKRDSDYLLIVLAVVKHGDNADRVALHKHKRVNRLVAEQQHVERVAVVRKGARDKAVIRRVVGRGVKYSVENDKARLLVKLVLLLAALFYLHNRKEVCGGYSLGGYVVPYVHICSVLSFFVCDLL